MSLRDYLKGKKIRTLHSNPITMGSAEFKPGEHSSNAGGESHPSTVGEKQINLASTIDELPADNHNPLKRRLWKLGRRKGLHRLLHWIGKKLTFIPPNVEEQRVIDEKKRRRQLENLLRNEVKIARKRIMNALDRLEFCYRYKSKGKENWIAHVDFSHIRMLPEAIYFKIDTAHLPRGVGIQALMADEVLVDLSLACGRRVSSKYDEQHGAWFILERAAGVLGIPAHVKFPDMLTAFPESADGLSIPIGIASNARPIYRSLGSMYSMLVGGTVGSGKSNYLNVIICTLIRRNSPRRLRLILVDLKGGLEFGPYEKIPHLMKIENICPTGITDQRQQVPKILSWLVLEGERRIEKMRTAGYKDIGKYNQHHRNDYLPHIILFIDEWADVKMEPKGGKVAEDLLTNIAQRFRAIGIHVILCTQVPKSEVISTRIKGVLPAVIAFSCPTTQMSIAILGHGHAKGLEPAGRAIFQHQTSELQIQTPYINEEMIQETINAVLEGKGGEISTKAHDVTELEIMYWALEHENGYLSRDRIFAFFGPRGLTKPELETWLVNWENEEFLVGSSTYRVQPAAGNRARRLVAIDIEGLEKKEDESKADENTDANTTNPLDDPDHLSIDFGDGVPDPS